MQGFDYAQPPLFFVILNAVKDLKKDASFMGMTIKSQKHKS
jgi:hypothetical protein